MADVESVNAAMARAVYTLQLNPQKDDFQGTIACAMFLFGSFLRVVDGLDPNSNRFTPDQLRAVVDGATEIWTKGHARRGSFMLIVERLPGGIKTRVERVS